MFPCKDKKSPTAPDPPEPVDIIETEKSESNKEANVSSVPAEIVSSPFPVNVFTNCLLTLRFVSLAPELEVVFNVLTVSYGNLNIEMFLFVSLSVDLFLVAFDLVDTSEPPIADDNSKEVSEMIASTILVIEEPASVVNVIESPNLNSVLNFVPKPVTTEPLFATDNVPEICKLSPFVLSKIVSAVYVGEPGIPICFVDEKSYVVTPLKPLESA